MPGPVPKRSDQRVRRNKDDVPVEKLVTDGTPVAAPKMDIVQPHPLITEMWESMKNSAQARYYEPSDWAFALVQFHFLNQQLWSGKPSAQMMATLNTALTSLLLTEGDRRRVRMEVERQAAQAEVVDIAAELAKRQAQ